MHTRFAAAVVALGACHGPAPATPAADDAARSHGELGGLTRSAVTLRVLREGIWGASTARDRARGKGPVS
jgi:hypothetical protein